jgi:hypothetical protein
MKPPQGSDARSSHVALTPELALVDLELAAEARSSLPRSDDTLARIELLVRASRIAGSRAVLSAPSAPARQVPASPPARRRLRAGRRTAVLAGGTVAAALVAALLIGVRVDLHGSPAGADTASIGLPPATRTETTPARTHTETAPARPTRPTARTDTAPAHAAPPRRAPAAPSGVARRFVWAPVASASGYRVQFFRGSTLVFSTQTPRAEVTIPRSWTIQGRRERLRPGDYQWYVWPVHGGLRDSTAVVQARLTVPRG